MTGTVAILLVAGLLVFLLAELLGHPWKGLLVAVLCFAAAAALGIYEEEERFRKSTLPQSAASRPSIEGFFLCLTRFRGGCSMNPTAHPAPALSTGGTP